MPKERAVRIAALVAGVEFIEEDGGGVDRWIMVAETRPNAILREIDRRRLDFAEKLRDKVQEAEDAEFETIEPKAIVSNEAAKT